MMHAEMTLPIGGRLFHSGEYDIIWPIEWNELPAFKGMRCPEAMSPLPHILVIDTISYMVMGG